MATVHVTAHGPTSVPHPSKGPVPRSQRYSSSIVPTNASAPPQQAIQGKPDLFYGQEPVARTCHRFITHLFVCPELPPSSTASSNVQAKLPYFIAYALHRTKLSPLVTYASLILLQRLKARFPTARGSSGHRLFISAFMIASKVLCDDTYSNKSWGIVAQNMFNLREINQMEREMCTYLDWELSVDLEMLNVFIGKVNEDFGRDRSSYPHYDLTLVSKRAARAANSTSATPMPEPHPTTSAIPMFTNRGSSPAKPPPPAPSTRVSSAASWGTPTTPETPSPSYSNSTSPASSISPPTPPGNEDLSAKIHVYEQSPAFSCVVEMPPVHPLKGKMFAVARTSRW